MLTYSDVFVHAHVCACTHACTVIDILCYCYRAKHPVKVHVWAKLGWTDIIHVEITNLVKWSIHQRICYKIKEPRH